MSESMDQGIAEITGYFQDVRVSDVDFLLFYGSCVYKQNSLSDIDLLISAEDTTQYDISELTDRVINVHKKHSREIDTEVPFENKLLYSFDEVEEAVRLKQFRSSIGRLVIPEVVKEPEYLNSQNVKLRLALNALTTPHKVIAENKATYEEFKLKAEIGILNLAESIAGSGEIEDFTDEQIFAALTLGPNGEQGEDYLGYKTEYPEVKEYLWSILSRHTLKVSTIQ